jgi:hypothetical protein
MLDSLTLFVRSPNPLTAEVDGEIVMLDPSSSDYFGLADVGARIWELCVQPQSVESLVAVLVDEYDVDADTCAAEVGAFVADLESSGLLVVAPAA